MSLIGRQRVHELVKHGPLLDIVLGPDLIEIIGHDLLLLCGALPAVR